MKDSRPKVVHYKRAVLTGSKSSLQSILLNIVGAGGTSENVLNRQEKINPADESSGFRFINRSDTFKTILFGQMVLFEKDKSQTLLEMNENVKFYNINSITSNEIFIGDDDRANKIKREFVDSILYFGILNNHIIIVQSSSLRSREFENHLNWLINLPNENEESKVALILQDCPSEETMKKMEKTPARSIRLGSLPISSEQKQEQSSASSGNVKTLKYRPAGKGGSILKAILGNNWAEDINLKDSLDDSNLQVSLEITYFRKTNDSGQAVIDSIATSLRHIDEADLSIKLQGGGSISGKELKLSGNLSVEYNNGVLDENDLFLKMHKWLFSKLDAGELAVK